MSCTDTSWTNVFGITTRYKFDYRQERYRFPHTHKREQNVNSIDRLMARPGIGARGIVAKIEQPQGTECRFTPHCGRPAVRMQRKTRKDPIHRSQFRHRHRHRHYRAKSLNTLQFVTTLTMPSTAMQLPLSAQLLCRVCFVVSGISSFIFSA